MPDLEAYRKQAKLLVRWHREGNYSIGGRIRTLERFRSLTDLEALTMKLPLTLAQEIIAVESGYPDWPALKAVVEAQAKTQRTPRPPLRLKSATPVLFVRNVQASAEFYRDRLGFRVDFLHGHPPFYGAVSRDAACLHLKFIHDAVFAAGRVSAEGLIMAFIAVDDISSLFAEFQGRGVEFAQAPTKQAWGGTDFHVRDPDGNVIAFAG